MHAAEFRRCLIDLDVVGIRRLWKHVSPHLPQPKTDDDALHAMHLARVAMRTLPDRLRRYSEAWLAERRTGRIMSAVGIAVIAPERRRAQAIELRQAMSETVIDAVKAGVDLDTEAPEVKRRMMAVRNKLYVRA